MTDFISDAERISVLSDMAARSKMLADMSDVGADKCRRDARVLADAAVEIANQSGLPVSREVLELAETKVRAVTVGLCDCVYLAWRVVLGKWSITL